MDPTLSQNQTAVSSPLVEDMVDSFLLPENSQQPEIPLLDHPIVEDYVQAEEEEQLQQENEDAGIRVGEVPQPQANNNYPIDPLTGKALPPKVDPLTGKIVYPRVDRESTIKNILDEEEQAEDEYVEVYEEEIVGTQQLEEPEQEWSPPPRHARVEEERPLTKAQQIMQQREQRARQSQRQQSEIFNVKRSVEQQQQQEGQLYDEQQPPILGRPYRRQNNPANVPPGFFDVKVDNPIDPSIKARFEPNFGKVVPSQQVMQGQGPDHRNGFYEDRDRVDSGRPTMEQEAAFASVSQQPHREQMDPSIAEQVASSRQQELVRYAEEQRNQVAVDQQGRPFINARPMPRVLPQRGQQPVGYSPEDDFNDGGFDPINQQTRSNLPRIVADTRSSPFNTAEDRLVSVIRKVVREEVDARLAPSQQQQQQQQQYAPQYGGYPQLQQQPQQQFFPQQPFGFAAQPTILPIVVQVPIQQQQQQFPQQFFQQPQMQPIVIQQQPSMLQQPFMMMPQQMMSYRMF